MPDRTEVHLDGVIDQAHPPAFAAAVQKIIVDLVQLAATDDDQTDIRILVNKCSWIAQVTPAHVAGHLPVVAL